MNLRFRQSPQLVCLDAAGTLFQVRGSVGAIYAKIAVAHGLPDREDLANVIEHRFRQAFAAMPVPVYRFGDRIHNDRVDQQWWRELVTRVMEGLGPLSFPDFFDRVYVAFADPSAWEIYPEVDGILENLRARGLRLAIVSNFDSRLLPVCEGLGLSDAVDAVIIAADAGVAKPGPGIFDTAVRRFGLQPADALHVGDSLTEDAEGASSAGLLAVHLQRDWSDAAIALPPGVRRIRDLRALPDLVGV